MGGKDKVRFSWDNGEVRPQVAVLFTTANCPLCKEAEKILSHTGVTLLVSNIMLEGEAASDPDAEQLLLRLKTEITVEGIKSAPILVAYPSAPEYPYEPCEMFYNFELSGTGMDVVIKGDHLSIV